MTNRNNVGIDVVIPIFNTDLVVRNCLESVLYYFDDQARLILLNSSDDPAIAKYLEEKKKQASFPVLIQTHDPNQKFIQTINQGINCSAENDVIVLASYTIVTENWIQKLHNAAYSQQHIAIVTPLSNFFVPEFGKANAIPEGHNLTSFANLIERISLKLYPDLPVGDGSCLYIKRTTLNLLGQLDKTYNSISDAVKDFCLRTMSHSLSNKIADDAFVFYQEKELSFQANHNLLLSQYPFYSDLINYYANYHSLQIWDNINAHLGKLKVGLDGRCLNDQVSGTQKYLIELIKAYGDYLEEIELDLLVSQGCIHSVRNILEASGVKTLPNFIEEGLLCSKFKGIIWDVFHITFQGLSISDFAAIRPYAKRIINTLQDLILAKNPCYFQAFENFTNYNFNLKLLLESVDSIITISDFIQDELLHYYQVSPERVKTVYHGVTQKKTPKLEADDQPLRQQKIQPKNYLLFVGNDFLHKNLDITVNILEKTQEWGYHYQLVVVGNAIAQGGSQPLIQEKLEQNLNLKESIIFLNHVSDQELVNLYRNAGVLLYLSNSEGFGLPPLEAFAQDCPVIASNLTSIPEIVAEGANCFHPGKINEIATKVVQLMEEEAIRDRAIMQGRERVKQFNWLKTARETIDVYYHALRLPPHQHQNFPSFYLQAQQLQATESALQQAQAQIQAMESSKFWKLRQKWLKVKSWLGQSTNAG